MFSAYFTHDSWVSGTYSTTICFDEYTNWVNKRWNKIKVLIVDDNKTITAALSKYFGFKKFDCKVANDGRNGLEMIKKGSFDVVLLDLAMPDFTGYDIIDELEKENKIKDQKIIVLTATLADEESIRKLKKSGIHSIQRKPMDLSTLIEVMSKI